LHDSGAPTHANFSRTEPGFAYLRRRANRRKEHFMEDLFGAIAFTLFAAAHLAAVIFVHRMEHPLREKYAANNDMTARNGAASSSGTTVRTRSGARAAQPA
jgi:hypothetical protein